MKELTNNPFVEVRVGQELYAIAIHLIKEIIRVPAITSIPASHPYFRGVIQLRNTVLPVFLLSVLLGSEPLPPARPARIVILQLADSCIGLMVDEVIRVTRAVNVQPSPDSGGSAEPEFLSGLYIDEGNVTGILNIDRLVAFLQVK